MHTLESENQTAMELARVARRFQPGTTVITTDGAQESLGEVRMWNDAQPGKYLVRDALSAKLRIVAEEHLREHPFYPAWERMTPLERATRWVGVCCDCRKAIPYAAIRCDEHDLAYRQAKAA